MVGAPISYSGNQPQPPPAAGTNPPLSPDATAKYAPPPHQMYSTPSASISVLLPYNGLAPPHMPSAPNMNPPASSAPFNTSYLYPPNPANTPATYPPASSAPPPYTPETYPPASPYTPATYPPVSSAPPPTYSPVLSTPPPFSGGYPPSLGMNQIPTYLSPQPTPSYYYPQAPTGNPAVHADAVNYAPPASVYNPQAANQLQPYGAYSAPPPTGGVYPPRY